MLSDDHDRESVERRLDAVERALAEGEPIDRIDRLDELETRLVELEAAVQALRGYVGSVRAVNEDVERRADHAIRKVDAIERHVGSERVDDAFEQRVGFEEMTDGADETGEDRETLTTLDRLRSRL